MMSMLESIDIRVLLNCRGSKFPSNSRSLTLPNTTLSCPGTTCRDNFLTFCCMACCHRSRPGRFTVFVQMEKYSWSHWDVQHAFIHRSDSHARCKLHVYLHVTCHGPCSPAWHPSWPLSCCVCLIIIAPLSPYLFKY